MSEDTGEVKSNTPIREFDLGKINVSQRENVSILEHPDFGQSFLIDITDAEDLGTTHPDYPQIEAMNVRQVLEKELKSLDYLDSYCDNNGVVVVITERLDPQERVRIYLGIEIIDKGKYATTESLDSEGFTKKSFNVPLSFDSALAGQRVLTLMHDNKMNIGDGLTNALSLPDEISE
jgi:hypothetical protein